MTQKPHLSAVIAWEHQPTQPNGKPRWTVCFDLTDENITHWDPEHGVCQELIKRGYDPETTISFYTYKGTQSFTSRSTLRKWAEANTLERSNQSIGRRSTPTAAHSNQTTAFKPWPYG